MRQQAPLKFHFLFTNQHCVISQKTESLVLLCGPFVCVVYVITYGFIMLENSVLFQLCVSGLDSMGIITHSSAGNFVCHQNMILQNCFMIVGGQIPAMRGHISLLSMRLKVFIVLKPEDMSHCSPIITT
jgi:hypothetical protein